MYFTIICSGRSERQGGEIYQSSAMLSNATSAFSTQSLISFLLLSFFSFKVPRIYLPMLSRHLKISKPIWHYLHHRRPLKFASVEWVWQAITPMQDIGNLTRICSDKSGRSGGGVPRGREGRQGRDGRSGGPAAPQEKNMRINSAIRQQRTTGRPLKILPESQIHANTKHRCQNTKSDGG